MEHLALSCLESRLEEDRSIYGRFLMGPFKVGQGATVATALRRALLSELRGVAITGASIRGIAHEYASIDGVRESALDIVLNLKQVVLSGEAISQLPVIGYINVHGPKAVKAKDLKLPTGIRCVNCQQHIATVSSTGILTMKLLISTGKGYLSHQSSSAESTHSASFAPRLRESGGVAYTTTPTLAEGSRRPTNEEAGEVASSSSDQHPSPTKSLRWNRAPLDLRHKRSLSVNRRRPLHVSGAAQDIIRYSYMRRLATKLSEEAIAILPSQKGLVDLTGLSAPNDGSHNLVPQVDVGEAFEEHRVLYSDKGNLLDTFSGGSQFEAGSAALNSNGSEGSHKLTSALSSPRGVELNKRATRGDGGDAIPLSPQDRWHRLGETMLPIDAVFMPVNKVNFLVQTDDQWSEPRERIVLEIWTNGSIHPRQAITEAASFLVHLFSLFRQAEPLSGNFSPDNLSAVQANEVRRGYSSRARDQSNLHIGSIRSTLFGLGNGNGRSRLALSLKNPARNQDAVLPSIVRNNQEASFGEISKDTTNLVATNGNSRPRPYRAQMPRIGVRRGESFDVGNLKISVQAYIAIKQAGIETIGDLINYQRDLVGEDNETKAALMDEIKGALAGLGFDEAL